MSLVKKNSSRKCDWESINKGSIWIVSCLIKINYKVIIICIYLVFKGLQWTFTYLSNKKMKLGILTGANPGHS